MSKNVVNLLLAVVAAGGAIAPCCLADDAVLRPCTASMLNGPYLLTIAGTRPAPRIAPGVTTGTPGTPEAVAGVFLQIFDGKGGFTHAEPVIVKGALSGLFPDQPGSGAYEVKGNCSGSFTVNLPQLPMPLEVQMVVFRNGKGFKGVVVSPQALLITVDGNRVD